MRTNRFFRYRELHDTGFSEKASTQTSRLLNKDGTYNVSHHGLSFFERFHLFHWLITMSWSRFLLVVFISFVLINTAFATLYVLVGIEGLSGDVVHGLGDAFLKAFFFSTQTLSTVGYGTISPINTACSTVAAFESFTGVMGFAMATGLLYGRFSKPQPRMIFSRIGVVAPFREGTALMVRMANMKGTQYINMSARIIMSRTENENGQDVRKFYNLNLDIDKISLMVSTWTLVHPITEESPFFGVNSDMFLASKPEILVLLNGYDETYSQEVHMRTSYTPEEIKWGVKFTKMLVQEDSGNTRVLFDQINETE